METLSHGDIAKLAGYSRFGIHRLAVEGKIPFKPIKQPPEGQYRYPDTPELRAWCEIKRYNKPKAEPRRDRARRRRLPSYARRGCTAREIELVFSQMAYRLLNRNAEPSDIQNAISLIDACAPLALAPLHDHEAQPCTRGTLIVLAQYLLGLPLFNYSPPLTAHEALCHKRMLLQMAMPKSE